MLRIIRTLSNKKSTNLGSEFPNRINSIKHLENNDFNKITDNFKSYGSFVNFCISESISVKSKKRRNILNIFLNKQKNK